MCWGGEWGRRPTQVDKNQDSKAFPLKKKNKTPQLGQIHCCLSLLCWRRKKNKAEPTLSVLTRGLFPFRVCSCRSWVMQILPFLCYRVHLLSHHILYLLLSRFNNSFLWKSYLFLLPLSPSFCPHCVIFKRKGHIWGSIKEMIFWVHNANV